MVECDLELINFHDGSLELGKNLMRFDFLNSRISAPGFILWGLYWARSRPAIMYLAGLAKHKSLGVYLYTYGLTYRTSTGNPWFYP